ncbi:hypothetical protein [Spectribacter hydrogenoxidans]|uniref:Uncharacterized protein n=1 Tax=Spectribacter hydrogenoxidans TaxID=3075608 RepID=A0ABU3BYD9_9GAMM|nr:hypothetical protein [Salinisphaera sp. W335]MDT0634332.1 hypothetical protein [Salinisphaera sp. W335]
MADAPALNILKEYQKYFFKAIKLERDASRGQRGDLEACSPN